MTKFIVKTAISAFALWLVTAIVAGVTVTPFAGTTDEWIRVSLTYLLLAFIFGIVNATLGTVIRVVTFPIYIITLGLVSILVNAFLLWIVTLISDAIGFGLDIDSYLWSGVLAALLLALFNWLISLVLRPLVK